MDTLLQQTSEQTERTAQKRAPNFERTTRLLGGMMAVFLILPIIALVWRAVTVESAAHVLGMRAVLQAVVMSLGTTAVSMLVVIVLGTPLAYVLARHSFPFKQVLATFVEMPIVMPPVVAGLALLVTFGRRGLLGAPLALLGIRLPFTPVAVIMAQVFVASPFYIRSAQTRFGALPRELEEAARMDGADPWAVLRFITLPLSSRALLAGLVLSWARALGEFGATILFAGNLEGRTQTMPLLVYSALERDLGATFTSALILLGMAAVSLGLLRWLTHLDNHHHDPIADR